MRNLLDTASIAQSLDGERLMGSLPFPKQRLVLGPADYKDPAWATLYRFPEVPFTRGAHFFPAKA
jgi:hypothetical protein